MSSPFFFAHRQVRSTVRINTEEIRETGTDSELLAQFRFFRFYCVRVIVGVTLSGWRLALGFAVFSALI